MIQRTQELRKEAEHNCQRDAAAEQKSNQGSGTTDRPKKATADKTDSGHRDHARQLQNNPNQGREVQRQIIEATQPQATTMALQLWDCCPKYLQIILRISGMDNTSREAEMLTMEEYATNNTLQICFTLEKIGNLSRPKRAPKVAWLSSPGPRSRL